MSEEDFNIIINKAELLNIENEKLREENNVRNIPLFKTEIEKLHASNAELVKALKRTADQQADLPFILEARRVLAKHGGGK